jgi:hypothetical protein
LLNCATRMSVSSGSIFVLSFSLARVVVLQCAVGFWADFDNVSRWRIGVFMVMKRSVGKAIIGSSLCVSGVKSGHLDSVSA